MKKLLVTGLLICSLSVPTSVFASTGAAATDQGRFQWFMDQVRSILSGDKEQEQKTADHHESNNDNDNFSMNWSGWSTNDWNQPDWNDKNWNDCLNEWKSWYDQHKDECPDEESNDIWERWYCY